MRFQDEAELKEAKARRDEIQALEDKLGITLDGQHYNRRTDSHYDSAVIVADYGYISPGGSVMKIKGNNWQ
jgi:hypothetical protein